MVKRLKYIGLLVLLFLVIVKQNMFAQFNVKTIKGTVEYNVERERDDSLLSKNNQPVAFRAQTTCTCLNNQIYETGIGFGKILFRKQLPNNLKNTAALTNVAALKNTNVNYVVRGLRLKSNPIIGCDTSRSEYRGRIYICWTDERYGTANRDVFIAYSDDKGEHWTEPILVTYLPNHKEQFKPQMTINPYTGYLYITYFDRQNYVDTTKTDLYLAASYNGGLKYDYYKLNTTPLNIGPDYLLNSKTKILNSNNLEIYWSQVFIKGKKTTNYMVSINQQAFNEYHKNYTGLEFVTEKTISFKDTVIIKWHCNKDIELSVGLTKPLAPGFERVLFKNKKYKAGNNSFIIDTKKTGLEKDTYTLFFYYRGRNNYVWLTEE